MLVADRPGILKPCIPRQDARRGAGEGGGGAGAWLGEEFFLGGLIWGVGRRAGC